MVTFKKIELAEQFILSVTADKTLSTYSFKAAFDFGPAYHFRFLAGREDDPYGTVVDRCARIAKLATSGLVACSGEFFHNLSESIKTDFVHIGPIALKGLSTQTDLYAMTIANPESTSFLKPLLNAINGDAAKLSGFRIAGRILSADEIRNYKEEDARPFLVRELLALPNCPYSLEEFARKRSESKPPEEFDRTQAGYVVDWHGVVSQKYENRNTLTILISTSLPSFSCALPLPHNYREVYGKIGEGTKVRFRGVIQGFYISQLRINYVELYFLDK